jgi:hypothetical protein
VLQRILVPLPVRMVAQSVRIQFNDHSNLILQPMGLEQYMVILLVCHLLLFVLELSTITTYTFKKRQKLRAWLEEKDM